MLNSLIFEKKTDICLFFLLLIICISCQTLNNTQSEIIADDDLIIQPTTLASSSVNADDEAYLEISTEYLIYWGQTELKDGNCIVGIVNTETKESSENPINSPWCHFETIEYLGEQYLISLPLYIRSNSYDVLTPSTITFYEVDENNNLHETHAITLENLRLTSTPQFSQSDELFFSAIEDGNERIYRYSYQTNSTDIFISLEKGFPTNPKLSSDRRYVAYEVWEDGASTDHNSRDDCNQQTCNLNSIHVLDIETGKDVNVSKRLATMFESTFFYFSCELEWSKSENLLVFDYGCTFPTPQFLIVYDADTIDFSTIIRSSNLHGLRHFGWFDSNNLLFYGSLQNNENSDDGEGYFIYIDETKTVSQLPDLDSRNKYDSDLIFFDQFTHDARIAIGQTQIPSEDRSVAIVITNINHNDLPDRYIMAVDEFVDNLTLSSTNKYFVYRAYNWANRTNASRFVILDALSDAEIFDSEPVDMMFLGRIWYIQE